MGPYLSSGSAKIYARVNTEGHTAALCSVWDSVFRGTSPVSQYFLLLNRVGKRGSYGVPLKQVGDMRGIGIESLVPTVPAATAMK